MRLPTLGTGRRVTRSPEIDSMGQTYRTVLYCNLSAGYAFRPCRCQTGKEERDKQGRKKTGKRQIKRC